MGENALRLCHMIEKLLSFYLIITDRPYKIHSWIKITTTYTYRHTQTHAGSDWFAGLATLAENQQRLRFFFFFHTKFLID